MTAIRKRTRGRHNNACFRRALVSVRQLKTVRNADDDTPRNEKKRPYEYRKTITKQFVFGQISLFFKPENQCFMSFASIFRTPGKPIQRIIGFRQFKKTTQERERERQRVAKARWIYRFSGFFEWFRDLTWAET